MEKELYYLSSTISALSIIYLHINFTKQMKILQERNEEMFQNLLIHANEKRSLINLIPKINRNKEIDHAL